MSDYAGVSEAMNLIAGNRINTRIIETLAPGTSESGTFFEHLN
jgi:hypothetical protein